MNPDLLIPSHTSADTSNRITLPKNFSDCLPWMRGTETLQAWILLVAPGRYRLLSDDEVQNNPRLEPVRSLILERKSASLIEPTYVEEMGRAAMVARLLPTIVAPPKPGWRVSFPRAFDPFVPAECDPKAFSILFSLEGFLEIWYTDILRKAAFLPLDNRE